MNDAFRNKIFSGLGDSGLGENKFDKLMAIVLALGGGKTKELTSDQLVDFAKALFNGTTEDYRSLIDAVPQLAEIPAEDIGKLIRALMRLITRATSSKEFLTDLAALQATRAKHRKSALDMYQKAGFKRGEAFELILADIASMRAMATGISSSSTKSSKNS